MGLIGHNVYIAYNSKPTNQMIDHFLIFCTILRTISAIPRPYFWWRMLQMYDEARLQPTPQQIQRKLQETSEHTIVQWNSMMGTFFFVWLFAVMLAVWSQGADRASSKLCAAMWWHCFYNVACIVIQRLGSVAMFIYLTEQDMSRGVMEEVLEATTTTLVWKGPDTLKKTDDDECVICFEQYQVDETIRVLKCGHNFHAKCIDRWLLAKQNKCPFCQRAVGVE